MLDGGSTPVGELHAESVWHLGHPDVRFGLNAIGELPFQLSQLGVDDGATGLVVTDETLVDLGHVDRLHAVFETAPYALDVYAGVERDPSVRAFADGLAAVDRHDGYDFFVGLGGGSCLDTAKVARTVSANDGELLEYVDPPFGEGSDLQTAGPPLVLVPTTAGTGAEVTAAVAITLEEQETKTAVVDRRFRADAAVLDPGLTTTLPPDLTAETAMDALGHAMEAFTTRRYDRRLRSPDPAARPTRVGRTEVTDVLLRKAIRLILRSLRRAVNNGEDLEARSDLLLGSMLARIAGGTAGANLCHAMAYPVASQFHTHHGETIAALIPASTLGYNVAGDPARFAEIAELLGIERTGRSDLDLADEAKAAFVRLQRDLDVLPSGLNDLAGITEADVDGLADRTIESQQRLLSSNPRRVTRSALRGVFRDALSNW